VPAGPEQKRLLELGHLGPQFALPAKCDKAGWWWLGKNRGFFYCHDGRSFLFDGGQVTPKGQIPGPCTRAFDSLTFGQGELFASCGPGKVWKTEGDRWRSFATLKKVELPSLSVTESCVFVASTRAIWRTCSR
jgi:hypothetical protein